MGIPRNVSSPHLDAEQASAGGAAPSGPILVTGMHRSGTTWVGKMLSANSGVTYIWEPLHAMEARGSFNSAVPRWYTYVCEENEGAYVDAFEDALRLRYHLRAALPHIRGVRAVARTGEEMLRFAHGRIRRTRPLLKDPFAVFSSEWFAHRLGCRVVITVRHPAAVVSSLKRLGWPFDLGDLLAQPLLMRDWLAPMRNDLEQASARPQDAVGSGSFLWRAIYAIVAELERRHPNFIVVRNEDLSRDPIGGYERLYDALDLSFTPAARRAVVRSSKSSNKKEVTSSKPIDIKVDSRANIGNWRHRLDAEEIDRVRSITGDVAGLYYENADWS